MAVHICRMDCSDALTVQCSAVADSTLFAATAADLGLEDINEAAIAIVGVRRRTPPPPRGRHWTYLPTQWPSSPRIMLFLSQSKPPRAGGVKYKRGLCAQEGGVKYKLDSATELSPTVLRVRRLLPPTPQSM